MSSNDRNVLFNVGKLRSKRKYSSFMVLPYTVLLFSLAIVSCQKNSFKGSAETKIAPKCAPIVIDVTNKGSAPNVMLVVDTSGSMKERFSAVTNKTKIEGTKEALTNLLTTWQNRIKFGLSTFPATESSSPFSAFTGGDDSCAAGKILVDTNDNNAQLIMDRVPSMQPQGGTPTAETLRNISGAQSLNDPSRKNIVILLTDGEPTCPTGEGANKNPADSNAAIEAVKELNAKNINTVVIGIGEDFNSTNPDVLNRMAEAGGVARAGDTKYFPANNIAELNAVFDNMMGAIVDCVHRVPYPITSGEQLSISFDGTPVQLNKEKAGGFDYDPNLRQVQFFGTTCDLLRSGKVKRVDVIPNCQ